MNRSVAQDSRRSPQSKLPTSTGVLQRQCACTTGAACAQCKDKDKRLQRYADHGREPNQVPPIVYDVLRSPGQPLDRKTREFFEPKFGADFGDVRVHTDARAAESAHAVNALAYTVGHDLVFAPGRYAPGTAAGQRLLAHELTHTVQQSDVTVPSLLRMDEGPNDLGEREASQVAEDLTRPGTVSISQHGKGILERKGAGPQSPKRQPARRADVPTLVVSPSASNHRPCACLVVIHNDEKNAKDTAQRLHRLCSYNMALLEPAGGSRNVTIAGKSIDPNELFPREVAEECHDNEDACLTGVQTGHPGTDRIRKAQKQFYLAISDCSVRFTIPVVALHNNSLSETLGYRKARTKQDSERNSPGVGDVDKSNAQTGAQELETLKAAIIRRFGRPIKKSVMDTPRTTNILRWCNAPEVSRCHIGDEAHPDNVVWVTNPSDFERLSKTAVNVVLQDSSGASAKGESESDLSTLFLHLRDRLWALVRQWETSRQTKESELRELTARIDAGNLQPILSTLVGLQVATLREAMDKDRAMSLRFVNIDAEGKALSERTKAGQDTTAHVLRSLGLYCCGEDHHGAIPT